MDWIIDRERKLLPNMTRRRQTDDRRGPTNYDTWQDEVGEVVERPSPDVKREVEFHVWGPLV